MQYTPHYNLNLPEGTDIVNPLVQDNPNYTAIDTALYNNKLRVVGTATHVKTGTNHALTLGDSDINQFKFVATGDYVTGDTFTVDGVTVTPRIADGSTVPNGAFKINSTVLCILDGSVLNLINVTGAIEAGNVEYNNVSSGLSATKVQGAIDELASRNWTPAGDVNVVGGTGASNSKIVSIPLNAKEILIQARVAGGTTASTTILRSEASGNASNIAVNSSGSISAVYGISLNVSTGVLTASIVFRSGSDLSVIGAVFYR